MEMRQDKMRRLEAHGEEYKLAPAFKINTLRMLMTGKAKEYFDVWEADRDAVGAAKSYEELLAKVKDYSRWRKLDISVKAKMQHGGDPMDVGAVGGYSWYGDVFGDVYGDAPEDVYAVGLKGRGKGKGKGK